VRGPGGKYSCSFIGTNYELEDGPELTALEKLIEDHGYYPYRAEPGELEARKAAGTLDELFLRLMRQRLEGWLTLADERLRPIGKRLFFMLGNDDPPPWPSCWTERPGARTTRARSSGSTTTTR